MQKIKNFINKHNLSIIIVLNAIGVILHAVNIFGILNHAPETAIMITSGTCTALTAVTCTMVIQDYKNRRK